MLVSDRGKAMSAITSSRAPLACVLALASMALLAGGSRADDVPSPCTLEGGPTHAVVAVIDAETVLLDDRQEVRLIGALAPRAPDLSPQAQPWRPEMEATSFLKGLVLGRSVKLAAAGRDRDRYGRRLAHLFIEDGAGRTWVQGELLLHGHARAYGLPGSYACQRELLAHEWVARQAGSGLWTNALYRLRSARATRQLLARRNSYELVAGTVAKVAETPARTYLNFGTDWRSDFTAGIEARVLRANPEWAKGLAALTGQRVEVRGWVQYRNGPYIDIEDPSQITVRQEPLPGIAPPSPDRLLSSEKDQAPPDKEKRPASRTPGAVDL